MAEGSGGKRSTLPWGLTSDSLKPNSVQSLSQSKLKAFSLGRTNPVKKSNPLAKKKEQEEKAEEAKDVAKAFEEFDSFFKTTSKTSKAFVRGDVINPNAGGQKSKEVDSHSSRSSGAFYKPTSRFLKEKEKEEETCLLPTPPPITKKPAKKKGTEKKKSILELFREELKRNQDLRKERHDQKAKGDLPLDAPEVVPVAETFKVEEYKDLSKGSFDSGDPLTTNLYVGNINPKMNEEMLCQTFGKFGPLASVKVMWPRTEEERARNKNCGFVAFMNKKDAEKALEAMKGSTVMSYDIQVGWGKAVPLPPHPIYVPPDLLEEKNSKLPDPPSGLPFNAQPLKPPSSDSKFGNNVPPPGVPLIGTPGGTPEEPEEENFEEVLRASMVKVVIPTDVELLRIIHRMIEFVIREGPMFEAMIMNREINNPMFQFLFDNQSPAHIYYRWKLFSILNGDSPETWRIEEFRMFDGGSLWKPPPLKNLLSKVLPPIEEIIKKGQLSAAHRDYLEDGLRSISVERDNVKEMMIWCLDHAESAAEIVDCISESLCITETPLLMKLARLFLVNDIVHNCTSFVPNSSSFRRGFESKLIVIIEHFHSVFKSITSRIRAEQFKRRVLSCLRAWDTMSVYHFNLVDKLRETFLGKTQEEQEKKRAFQTVALLMKGEGRGGEGGGGGGGEGEEGRDIDGVPLLESEPIDFSRTGGGEGAVAGLDGEAMELADDLDGAPMADGDIDGVPLDSEDIDGMPMEGVDEATPTGHAPSPKVKSKWDLVDYEEDSSEEEGPTSQDPPAVASLNNKERQQLLAEIDEKKRKILREVEVKVMELSDALETAGSYSKSEITERLQKYRDRMMQEAVEPSRSPTNQKSSHRKSRSPSPSVLAKYNVQNSPKKMLAKSCSPNPPSSSSSSSSSPSPSPPRRKRSKSPSRKRKRSSSPTRKDSHSLSPTHKRSKSKTPTRQQSRSKSPTSQRSKSKSPSQKSKSKSPTRKRSKSKSPTRKRSKSKSPIRRRSKTPTRRRSKSKSPKRRRSKSKSPTRKRSKSRSPTRKRSKSPTRRRSKSKSPKRRAKAKSPTRKRSKSRSPRRKRSRSPRKRSRSPKRRRSRSPHSRKHRSRSPRSKKSSKRRSRSRSPHKSKSSSRKNRH